jgi:hypothetical protein
MNELPEVASEENLERRQALLAAMLFSVAVALGSSAARVLIDDQTTLYEFVSMIRAGGGIAAALLVVYSLWFSLSNRKAMKLSQLLDGFVRHAYYRAAAFSWIITFLTLTLMNELVDGGSDLPTEFYTKLATAILLASFSMAYFFITRIDGDED